MIEHFHWIISEVSITKQLYDVFSFFFLKMHTNYELHAIEKNYSSMKMLIVHLTFTALYMSCGNLWLFFLRVICPLSKSQRIKDTECPRHWIDVGVPWWFDIYLMCAKGINSIRFFSNIRQKNYKETLVL